VSIKDIWLIADIEEDTIAVFKAIDTPKRG
jgi:hypothetical protein